MKVTLIDATGFSAENPSHYAAKLLIYTKNTRLVQGEESRAKVDAMSHEEIAEELKYIANTIRSSWEFIDYAFEIKGVTRAFTHQFVRTRTASYAQQSMRSVDMCGFEVDTPESVMRSGAQGESVWREAVNTIKGAYSVLTKLSGVPTEDARGLLPTNVKTNIIVKMNLRTLADLAGKRINPRAQGEYSSVVREMAREAMEVHPWILPFLSPERTATPSLDAILKESLGDDTPFSRPQVNEALKELDKLKSIWG